MGVASQVGSSILNIVEHAGIQKWHNIGWIYIWDASQILICLGDVKNDAVVVAEDGDKCVEAGAQRPHDHHCERRDPRDVSHVFVLTLLSLQYAADIDD